MEKNLEGLRPSESGVVISASSKSLPVKRRLTDMGITPGTVVTVKKTAPLGDPIEISLRGYSLSLRKEDAKLITIRDLNDCDEKSCSGSKTVYPPVRRSLDASIRMRREHAHEQKYHTEKYDGTAHDSREIKAALVGNPNCGKTTLFNALTGSNQYVGNWPGVTVEKKEGLAKADGHDITIVDLPGIYSLSPYSMEEIVSRDFIINERPDIIINIVDSTNIERNLYLTVQLLELERPMVIALNFMDAIEKRGDKIDVARMSAALGVPVIPISAKNGENLEKLLSTAHEQIHEGFTLEPDELYDEYTHEIHHRVGALIHDRAYEVGLPAHWASIKLIEGDHVVEDILKLDDDTKKKLNEIYAEYESSSSLGDRETLIADSRYSFIEKVIASSYIRNGEAPAETTSDKIDKVLTHRVLAMPIFLVTMLLIFLITFGPVGSFLSDIVARLIDNYASAGLHNVLVHAGAADWLISLICDGIISGVGGVLTFLPQIALLFLFLSLLEDSGYMSRGAFIMDRLLRHFGLSGKAFIPMLMGFGCSVPAVMGARTMENEKDRRMTIMLIPFMSCSAKLPVYGLISAAFFGKYAGLVVFGLYILGMIMAIVSGTIFSKTIFRGEPAAFVMELPPYRVPSAKNTLHSMWDKVRGFIVRAGTVILVMSVVLWMLESFTSSFRYTTDASESILAAIGSVIAVIFKPAGFGVWPAAVALLTGIIAKESVVASLSMFHGFSLSASSSVVAAALSSTFTPASAFSFLVFVLLYVPCVAAVSTIRKEMNSLKWTAFSILWQLVVAYVISVAAFQLTSLLF